MKKKKPYKYSSKSRLTPNTNSFPFKANNLKKETLKNLENTLTKFRIIEDSPKEKDSLDNSFLEGRVDSKDEKGKKNKNNKKNKKVTEKFYRNDRKNVLKISFFRKLFLTLSGVCAVLLVLLYSASFFSEAISKFYNSTKGHVTFVDKSNSNIIDDNYLFVGGVHTSSFSFSKYGLDYHYVNVSSTNLTTSNLLDNMKMMIYDYNPSVVFLEFGFTDLNNGVSRENFLLNYERIIEYIQSNRPNATIYVESIYPISKDGHTEGTIITNKEIKEINESLRKMAKTKNVGYLDVYSALSERDNLNSKYTDDGILLNENGYKELLKEIQKLVA